MYRLHQRQHGIKESANMYYNSVAVVMSLAPTHDRIPSAGRPVCFSVKLLECVFRMSTAFVHIAKPGYPVRLMGLYAIDT